MDEKQYINKNKDECVSYSSLIGKDFEKNIYEGAAEVYHINYTKHLPEKDKLVLELGCSDGIFLKYLATNGFENITGVDLDADAIGICRERLKKYNVGEANIVHSDIFDYLKSVSSDSVPCIVMNDVIEHFPKEELLCILKEVYRVLENTGVFIAKTGNIENPFNIGLFLRDFTHHIAFTMISLESVLVNCGFSRDGIIVKPFEFSSRTLKQKMGFVSSFFMSSMIKLMAHMMRMSIKETCKLIFCIARK
jgi:SAM-dependent methyltransferase